MNNAWDAVHSAALYLCGGRGKIDNVETTILRYNPSAAYVLDVMEKATAYGLRPVPGITPVEGIG